MTQRLEIGLNSKVNEFAGKFSLTNTPEALSNVFEHFANYVVASNLSGEELENINAISTGKAEGIDGIVILINDKFIFDLADLEKLGINEKLRIEFGFIQSTTNGSFNGQKFKSLTDEVIKLLHDERKIEPFSSIYAKLYSDVGGYIDRMDDTPTVSLFFVSGRTAHTLPSGEIESEKRKFTDSRQLEGKLRLGEIYFYQAEEIKSEYDKIVKYHSSNLKLEKWVQLGNRSVVQFSLLATVKFTELKRLILTSNNTLREKLFVENVRNFIGNTDVNNDIKTTLDNDLNRDYFPFLNNGITIMCDEIENHPARQGEFILSYPRIINGCQTTHILFKKYNEPGDNIDDVEIVVKVIATQDNDLKKKIIFASNNQNSIDKDLQSLNDFHEKVEQHFSGRAGIKLYFERLRGQHAEVNPPHKRINIETLAKVYISVFLEEPHKMKSNALQRIEEHQKERRIFSDERTIPEYYYCALLYYWMNTLLANSVFELATRTVDMHLLMSCDRILVLRGLTDIEQRISLLQSEADVTVLFKSANDFLNQQAYLFERRGFYSAPKTKDLLEKFV